MFIHIIIKGNVQGVFYRSNAKKKADELGITGNVKNNSDDSVEIIAEGKKNKLNVFVEWCKEGPITADIQEVEVNNVESLDHYDNFSIVY